MQTKIVILVFFCCSILHMGLFEMAECRDVSKSFSPPSSSSAVYIVYTEKPTTNEQPEAYYIKILATVLGSEKAAKEALIYTYKIVLIGFSAKLTPKQAEELSKKGGVIQVVPSGTVQLDSHSAPLKPH